MGEQQGAVCHPVHLHLQQRTIHDQCVDCQLDPGYLQGGKRRDGGGEGEGEGKRKDEEEERREEREGRREKGGERELRILLWRILFSVPSRSISHPLR